MGSIGSRTHGTEKCLVIARAHYIDDPWIAGLSNKIGDVDAPLPEPAKVRKGKFCCCRCLKDKRRQFLLVKRQSVSFGEETITSRVSNTMGDTDCRCICCPKDKSSIVNNKDKNDNGNTSQQNDKYTLRMQPGASGFTLKVTWDWCQFEGVAECLVAGLGDQERHKEGAASGQGKLCCVG